MEYEKIKDRDDIVRDPSSRAILAVDNNGLKSYQMRKKQSQKIGDLEERLERMEKMLERTEKILGHIANIGTD